jgi:Uma2 family endonuclease
MSDIMAMPATLYRFTVDEYHRMGDAGIFHEDDRVELIDGQVVQMSPIGVTHAAGVNSLTQRFAPEAGRTVVLSVQNPVILGEYHEPQPDVVLLKPRADNYRTRHPGAEDILLLIEVADTTLRQDRLVKLPIYARAGVFEVWIVNLPDAVIEVYREPRDGRYQIERVFRRGEAIAPLSLPDVNVRVEEVLG